MPADLDIEAIKVRADAARDFRKPNEEARWNALAHASDDMWALIKEVERLRASSSPEALSLTEKLTAIELMPLGVVDIPLLDEVADAIMKFIESHGPKRYPKNQTWGMGVGPAAIDIIAIISRHIKERLKGARRV